MTFSFTTAYAFDPNVSSSITTNLSNQIKSLSVSTDKVTIDCNGKSEFIDAISTNNDGSTLNVNYIADWNSSNPNVAVPYQGRILPIR